jgi:uncharacterized protein YacL
MAVILKEPYVLQRDNHMPKRGLSTSMGIALTLLIAGITVQVTDNLELFGHNSFIPLIIGLVIIFVGVSFFLIRRQITKGRQHERNL